MSFLRSLRPTLHRWPSDGLASDTYTGTLALEATVTTTANSGLQDSTAQTPVSSPSPGLYTLHNASTLTLDSLVYDRVKVTLTEYDNDGNIISNVSSVNGALDVFAPVAAGAPMSRFNGVVSVREVGKRERRGKGLGWVVELIMVRRRSGKKGEEGEWHCTQRGEKPASRVLRRLRFWKRRDCVQMRGATPPLPNPDSEL